jgi:hypothetical protein
LSGSPRERRAAKVDAATTARKDEGDMFEGEISWTLGMLRFPPGAMADWLASPVDLLRVEEAFEEMFEDASDVAPSFPSVRAMLGGLKGQTDVAVSLQKGKGPDGTDQVAVFGQPRPSPGAANVLPLLAAFISAPDFGGEGLLLCRGTEGAIGEGSEDDFVWLAQGEDSGPAFRVQGEELPLPPLPLDDVVQVIGDAFGKRDDVAFLLGDMGYAVEDSVDDAKEP